MAHLARFRGFGKTTPMPAKPYRPSRPYKPWIYRSRPGKPQPMPQPKPPIYRFPGIPGKSKEIDIKELYRILQPKPSRPIYRFPGKPKPKPFYRFPGFPGKPKPTPFLQFPTLEYRNRNIPPMRRPGKPILSNLLAYYNKYTDKNKPISKWAKQKTTKPKLKKL